MIIQDQKTKNAYFGGGCFWCIEAVFKQLNGVIEVTSGYSGGLEKTANYKAVSSGQTEHAEICKIKYNPEIITFEMLLEVFFLAHDPTTLNQQGNDVGRQYRSIIFFNNTLEYTQASNYIKTLESNNIYQNITTEIIAFDKFYKAEEYHQNYFNNNPNKSYCTFVINPKIQKLRKKLSKYYLK